ncbi:SO2930 family diheme c-type cytochrome [Erythrobacter dokdonensis]|uniref:PSCyt1 domain-containing protein n=1 Tax=Erythrobacter dokdonensis DSW-74 TaxID=1300349 RepID=A0A1A7BJ20_9SPHN|nr:SO2930 family diheme c-type cytochrome [Erythrobacter dokdonensis]OBV11447.1 PSCyt1 domain-containing protein [Erythrobacter dokdonensis DSW-74]
MRRSVALLLLACASFGAVLGHASATGVAAVSDAAVQGESFPRKLSDFGFFAEAARQVPAAGVTPYALNTPLWSDGAEKLRFIYLPQGTQLAAEGDGLLRFPVGSAIIKTFAFGEGEARRLIETRVLLHRAEGWVALPYRWNSEQTEATLALAGGRLDLVTPAGEAISYAIPNKNQCKSCHSKDGEVIPIGPKARNLSQEWLGGMAAAGLLDAVPVDADSLPDWATHATGPAQPLARAYLDVNCAHCHQPGGGASNSGLDLRWEQDDPHAIGIMKRPVAAGRGAGGHDFSILPGQPDKSILLYRMDSAEPGVAMPELGKASVDRDGVAVVRRWISELKD